MSPEEILTRWTVRVAVVFYVLAVAIWLAAPQRPSWQQLAGLAWTAGCACYLAHVASAFHFYHGWSHEAAYRETARRTAELFGWNWGGGLYWNYLFTAAWATDVAWWWRGPERYHRRPRWLAAALHVFLAFMMFQATVVFGSPTARWMGLTATLGLAILWRWRSGD